MGRMRNQYCASAPPAATGRCIGSIHHSERTRRHRGRHEMRYIVLGTPLLQIALQTKNRTTIAPDRNYPDCRSA
jgi:hypothetical protein